MRPVFRLKPLVDRHSVWRAGFAAGGCLLVLGVAGCGGGGDSAAPTRSVPTAATRATVHTLALRSVQSVGASGAPTASLAAWRNTAGITATGGGTGAGSGGVSSSPTPLAHNGSYMPMMGGYMNAVLFGARNSGNAAALNNPTGAATTGAAGRALRRTGRASVGPTHHALLRSLRRTRDDGSGSSGSGSSGGGSVVGSPGDPAIPDFYFDEYLGLWVNYSQTATKIISTFYEDEAKTKPAGSMEMSLPAEGAAPQVFTSTYAYTAGSQKGAHGSYEWVVASDYSGHSSYENVYADGSSDSGSSSFTATGEYTWTAASHDANGGTSRDTGVFHSDGSGKTHSETADGYVSDYTYNADGSGSAKLQGPASGLPATLVWNTEGHYTITYADGSKEEWDAWAVALDGTAEAGNTTGNGSGGTTTSDAPPAPPNS